MKVNNSAECEKCIYGKVDNSDKAKVMIYCTSKDKNYIYGRRINCEDAKMEDK